MSVASLALRGVRVEVSENFRLGPIDMDIPLGSTTAIMGPSGGGKTTLLLIMGMLRKPQAGTIHLAGEEIFPSSLQQRKRPLVGIVFQRPSLWANRTVLENVAMPLMVVRKLRRTTAEEMARLKLEDFGVGNLADRYPDSVSGGEAQRVALARALAMEPVVLLLDEITSALDVENRAIIIDILSRLTEEDNTIVMATHALPFAVSLATRAAFLEDGNILEAGEMKDFLETKNLRVRRFLSLGLTQGGQQGSG